MNFSGGTTLHSGLDFKFGTEYVPLNGKRLDQMRNLLEDLELIIIDEISMISSDMFYKVNQRLQEIFISEDYFGGRCALVVGDVMQLKPPKGRFVFMMPKSNKYKPLHEIDPLWEALEVAVLKTNHRQGQGNLWCDVLNRFRIDEQTEEDVELLETRRLKNFPNFDADQACHVFYTNVEVYNHNMKILRKLQTKLYQIPAICFYPKKYKPEIKGHGTIDNTQFMKVLEIKVGSKVMLVFNIATNDSLVNGSMGRVSKIVHDGNDVKAIVVDFDDKEAGSELVKNSKEFCEKHGIKHGVPIFRISFEYLLPYKKSTKSHSCKGRIEQFPMKLSDGSTAHKFQGISVKKGSSLVMHGHPRMPRGMGYVMLSRCADINSVYLDDKFEIGKIKCDDNALEENSNLNERNIIPQFEQEHFDIFMVNVNRLKKNLIDLEHNPFASKSRIVAVVETWLTPEEHVISPLGTFEGASYGNGKGCGVFNQNEPQEVFKTICDDHQILSYLSELGFSICIVYISSGCNFGTVTESIKSHISNPNTIILGDFNFDKNEKNSLTKSLQSKNFVQIIRNPTHEKGRTIDHVYVPKESDKFEIILRYPYFTDHAAICVNILKQ